MEFKKLLERYKIRFKLADKGSNEFKNKPTKIIDPEDQKVKIKKNEQNIRYISDTIKYIIMHT